MDTNVEAKVIKMFFYKNRQERLLFELKSKKRQEFIHKLCHRYKNLLNPGYSPRKHTVS